MCSPSRVKANLIQDGAADFNKAKTLLKEATTAH